MRNDRAPSPLRRVCGERRYKKLFVIATEGFKTEPQYFELFNRQGSVVHVKCLSKASKSAPGRVLKTMSQYLRKTGLRPSDEAWVVVDRDRWMEADLALLHEWSQKDPRYGLAVSNPKFEFWLLLHFQNGDRVSTPDECVRRLKEHLPRYDKGINARKFDFDSVRDAIRRAKMRDSPPCSDWPRVYGTTVYKPVEKILNQ